VILPELTFSQTIASQGGGEPVAGKGLTGHMRAGGLGVWPGRRGSSAGSVSCPACGWRWAGICGWCSWSGTLASARRGCRGRHAAGRRAREVVRPGGSHVGSQGPLPYQGSSRPGPPGLGTLVDCIIALSPAERGLARHYRGGPEHGPGYRPGDFTGAMSIAERDARTRRLSQLEEQ